MTQHRLTELPSGLRIVTERMDGVRSASLGFYVHAGSRGETARRGRALALPRAPAVQGHRPLRVRPDRPAVRRLGRRAQRRHGQGVHDGLRADARRPPAARLRRDRRHGVAARVRRRRPRAPGRARGDRDVRGRPAGHGLRRARRGGVRRPSARPRRSSAARRWSPTRRSTSSAPSTPAATCPSNVVIAAAGSVDHDAGRRAGRRARSAALERDERRPGARRRARGPAGDRALPAQGHRAGARLPRRRRACRATTSAASPARVLDAIFGGLSLVAAVPGGARGARPGLQRLLVRRPVPGHGPDRPLRRHPARQPRPGDGGRRATSWTGCARTPATRRSSSGREENVKARIILALESSSARMSRLGSAPSCTGCRCWSPTSWWSASTP